VSNPGWIKIRDLNLKNKQLKENEIISFTFFIIIIIILNRYASNTINKKERTLE
jgi:hypothetical protein